MVLYSSLANPVSLSAALVLSQEKGVSVPRPFSSGPSAFIPKEEVRKCFRSLSWGYISPCPAYTLVFCHFCLISRTFCPLSFFPPLCSPSLEFRGVNHILDYSSILFTVTQVQYTLPDWNLSLHCPAGPLPPIPPSWFQIVEASQVDPLTEQLLAEAYSPLGHVDHLTQVMGLHPHYLESFLRSQFYLLRMDGPLPLHCRHYIAIMVNTDIGWT